MVAAGSMVAAVEGLQMRMVGDATMSQKLTEQLAQTIRSDPVGTYVHDKTVTIYDAQTDMNCHSSGLPQGVSGTNRVIAGNKSQTGTTAAAPGQHGHKKHQ